MSKILDHLLHVDYGYFDQFSGVYLFGSALWSDTPGDLDILLVYESTKLQMVQSAAANIVDKLSMEFDGLPIHLTTLSESELVSTDFLSKITYVNIRKN